MRGPAASSLLRACTTMPGVASDNALAAATKSCRRLRCSIVLRLSREPLAALGAAAGNHVAATNSRHAAAESVPAFANEFRRLVSALHNKSPYFSKTSLKHQYFQIHDPSLQKAEEAFKRKGFCLFNQVWRVIRAKLRESQRLSHDCLTHWLNYSHKAVRGAFHPIANAASFHCNNETASPVLNPAEDQNPPRSPTRWIPLILIVVLMALAYAFGLHKHLNLQDIADNREELRSYIAQHWAQAVLIYAVVYVVAVALSFPAAGLLTVIGGLLFGWLVGALTTVISATIGATIIFLAAKTSLEKILSRKSGRLLTRVRDGFAQNAFSYLLFLRFVPLFPFWLVNIASALARIKLSTFIPATFIGIIPITLVFSFFGASLDSVIDAQRAAYDACVLQSGVSSCHYDLSLKRILTPQTLLALGCLGLIALIPVLVKKLRAKT
jgi:uncharacterized membrane protein YdjX (TVP38/TMEM64 family)